MRFCGYVIIKYTAFVLMAKHTNMYCKIKSFVFTRGTDIIFYFNIHIIFIIITGRDGLSVTYCLHKVETTKFISPSGSKYNIIPYDSKTYYCTYTHWWIQNNSFCSYSAVITVNIIQCCKIFENEYLIY